MANRSSHLRRNFNILSKFKRCTPRWVSFYEWKWVMVIFFVNWLTQNKKLQWFHSRNWPIEMSVDVTSVHTIIVISPLRDWFCSTQLIYPFIYIINNVKLFFLYVNTAKICVAKNKRVKFTTAEWWWTVILCLQLSMLWVQPYMISLYKNCHQSYYKLKKLSNEEVSIFGFRQTS